MICRILFLLLLRVALLMGLVTSSWAQTPAKSDLFSSAPVAGRVLTTPHVRAELMAYAPDGVQAGKPLWLGLHLQHQAGWHTYWKNPGDSGLATQLHWTLPAGVTAGAIQWPTPQKIPVANLANYGYEGAVLLTVPVTVAGDFQSASSEFVIRLKAQWLACKTECIPEEGEFLLSMPVRGATALSRPVFIEFAAREPKPHTGAATYTPSDRSIKLSVAALPAAWQGKRLELFAEDAEVIETAATPDQNWQGTQWTAVVALGAQRAKSPADMAWVIKIAGSPSNPSLRVQAKLDGAWPAAPAAKPSAISPALEAALEKSKQEAKHRAQSESGALTASWTSAAFWMAVSGALLGGLILNLMPCVLPVLAIKLLSFSPNKVVEAKSSTAKVMIESTGAASVLSDDTLSLRSSSGLFALGVVGSFGLLGLLLLILRGAGQSLGWGFQLQSPYMVMALALLFMLIGLNLFEAFELRLVFPRRLVNFQSSHPAVDTLASGALAVLIATPCTAPFMGASLGLAISLPAAQAILIFVAMGLGMALPFLLIAAYPRVGGWLLNLLPKPGSWMVTMRHFLAWPVFATVFWLVWIYAQQTSINEAFALSFSLLMLTAFIWSVGLPRGLPRTLVMTIFTLSLLSSFALWHSANDADGSASVPGVDASIDPNAPAGTPSLGVWTAWTPQAQAAARAAGKPVLVDFTAAWCLTCQVNKSSTLSRAEVEAAFKAKQVVLLRADWTKPNPAIAAELTRLGRSGLPVYALYSPKASQPQLLPEVLTPAIVLDALAAF